MYGQSDTEKLAAVRNLVDQGVRNGAVPSRLAEQFYAVAGRPARTVTITLQVEGPELRGDARTNNAVEQALAGVARQASLTVVPGSVRVS